MFFVVKITFFVYAWQKCRQLLHLARFQHPPAFCAKSRGWGGFFL